jgi:hypothetical protein
MHHTIAMYDTVYYPIIDLDDSVAASSRAPPEVAENPGPLEAESSLGQLDEDPQEDEEEPVRDDPTAAEIVQAGITRGQLDVTIIPIDQRDLDVTEEQQLIQKFVRDGCKCDLGPTAVLALLPSQLITSGPHLARWLT